MRTTRPFLLSAVLILATLVAGCSVVGDPGGAVPDPLCTGLKVGIPGALPCDAVATRAVEILREQAPDQVARGITEVTVELAFCPAGELPPQVDCAGVTYAQMVRVSFGPASADGPIEDHLVVALEPVTGRLLGIVNPLIR
jgi:hypothetical protein